MTILRVGDWAIASRILSTAPARMRRALDIATLQEAHYLRRKVVEGFREQAPGGQPFLALSAGTLAVRKLRNFRGTKALIVRGDLRNSINVRRMGSGAAFVGVLKSARAKDGKSLANIAEVHEFGSNPIIIKITPKMRAFLHIMRAENGRDSRGRFARARSQYAVASTGFIVMRIPARPFLRPVVEKYFKPNDVRDRFLGRVAAALNGDFGSLGIAIPR